MAHEFCNPLKTHKFEHHEKLGIGFMGFSTPLKTCEILMAFFMGISWSCVWWRKIHGPRIWKFSKDFHGIFHGIFMAKTHEKAITLSHENPLKNLGKCHGFTMKKLTGFSWVLIS